MKLCKLHILIGVSCQLFHNYSSFRKKKDSGVEFCFNVFIFCFCFFFSHFKLDSLVTNQSLKDGTLRDITHTSTTIFFAFFFLEIIAICVFVGGHCVTHLCQGGARK